MLEEDDRRPLHGAGDVRGARIDRHDRRRALESGRPLPEGQAAGDPVGHPRRAHRVGQFHGIRPIGCHERPAERAQFAKQREQAGRGAAVFGPAPSQVHDDRIGREIGRRGAVGFVDHDAQIGDDLGRARALRQRQHLVDFVHHDAVRNALAALRIGVADQTIGEPVAGDDAREIAALVGVADAARRARGGDEPHVRRVRRERDREVDAAKMPAEIARRDARRQARNGIDVRTLLHDDGVVAAACNRDVRVGKRAAQRRDRRRRENQIAHAIQPR